MNETFRWVPTEKLPCGCTWLVETWYSHPDYRVVREGKHIIIYEGECKKMMEEFFKGGQAGIFSHEGLLVNKQHPSWEGKL